MECLGPIGRGELVSVVVGPSGVVLARVGADGVDVHCWIETEDHVAVINEVEQRLRPRWLWWAPLIDVRVTMCWDLLAVDRLLFGGWRTEPALAWAKLHNLSIDSIPSMGQLDLLSGSTDEGEDLDDPVRPDGHLRPEWIAGRSLRSFDHMSKWGSIALRAYERQLTQLRELPDPAAAETVARSESLAELMCLELQQDGLPIDVPRLEAILASSVGTRPATEADVISARERRDQVVLAHVPAGVGRDLRNPAQVRSMLRSVGIDVSDTRAWRLEPFRGAHPLVDALLVWRKAERLSTTYGFNWLDQHVGADGRLRGAWSGSDGAAGRMTAQAGLHNLPGELRDAVVAEPGLVFVHADLGQIEPRVLAAVSGDAALCAAALEDDMYSPVAARLGVDRATAKLAVLGAMYGATSGVAGEALRGLERAYPVAMGFLDAADKNGRYGIDIRTYGGRLVHMRPQRAASADADERSAAAAQGRYARNALIQGAAAELFKAWAVTVRGRISALDARIVMCLHDELLVHAPRQHAEEVSLIVEGALSEAARRWMPTSNVRYVAVARVIERWSEAK